MAKNINNLPYFKNKSKMEERLIAEFLLRKFRPRIKKELPQHFLAQPVLFKKLEFIEKTCQKYPYFLRFDIKLYYPSINHKILLKKLAELNNNSSRRFKKCLEKDIPLFLSQSPYDKGLPVGSALSHALAGIFLLDLDYKLKSPFLRQADDYLVFCRNKKEPESLLKNIILPKLKELDLEINEKKLKSGKVNQDKFDFIGFDFFAGRFTVQRKKIEEFRKKIVKITHLTKKKPEKAVIKSLNNKTSGFGHYYRFSSCKRTFGELDAFIRMRLRRYLSRNKDSKNKHGNLLLTNETLQSMGLKSLSGIKEKYAPKTRHIFKKKAGNKNKFCILRYVSPKKDYFKDLEQKSHFYEQKIILKELKKITALVKRLHKNTGK